VAITGQGGLERLHQESHQAIDVLRMFEPVTKWNTQLDSPDIIHESVRKAFKVAEYEKPGATHLELPEDVAAERTDVRPLEIRERVPFAAPNPDTLARVQEFLRVADRPIVVAGNGAVRTQAATQLREFVDTTGIPVVSTYMGKGAVSDADECSLMTLGSGTDSEAVQAISRADLVITVGYDIAEHDPAHWNDGTSPLVHIDSEVAEVYEAYDPDIEMIADSGRTLQSLTEWYRSAQPTFEQGWFSDFRDRIVAGIDRTPRETAPFTLKGVIPLLREAMAPEDVLVSDVGNHKMAIAQNFQTYEPNTCLISNGLASMGIAVPGGLAADLEVDSNVVAATGDGGFLMNAAEIETATRLDSDYTIVVFNDNDYGLISKKQRDHTGESFGTGLTNPDLVAFAESFGIDGYRPESKADLQEAITSAVGGDMALIEVPIQ
jgi:acetolactate synthase-1/2/3 large subunit